MKYLLPRFWQLLVIPTLLILGNSSLLAQTFPDPGITLPPGKTICITYEVTVNEDVCPEGTILANPNISNQSTVSGDNFITVMTDDPDNPAADPSPTITPIASLTLGDLVYEDVNRDGDYDDGTDVGIAGVVLNLYLDDGDGVLDAGDGAPIAMTTTDNGIDGSVLGEYIFEGICPGDYIVEVAPSNFMMGNALYNDGLGTQLVSSPPGPAPDPDNDQNNDDNGAPVAGFGIASQAITLDFGTEPTNDGDDDANTNLSLDFGFKTPTQISIDNVTMTEGNAPGTTTFAFNVSRSSTEDAIDLTVNTADGSASAPGDFTAIVGGSISFTAGGSFNTTVNVTVIGDAVVEDDETFEVILSGAPPYVQLIDNTGEGTINNDDVAELILSGGTSQNEGNSGTTVYSFTATLSVEVQDGFTVAYTTDNGTATVADNDYVDNDGTLTFNGTSNEMQTITVLVNGDTKVELNETFEVTLGAMSMTSMEQSSAIFVDVSPQTGTITNDDQATLSINDVSMIEGTGSNPTFTFTVTLDKEVDSSVDLSYATADGTAMDENTPPNDYNATSGMLNFAANTAAPQQMTIDVTVIGDMASEPDETFFVNLSNLQANGRNVVFPLGDSQGEATILDDDCDLPDVPILTDDESICSGGAATIMVTAGNLDDATEWVLYSGSCGGTFEQSNTTGEFTVSPTVTTTYFMRGEGGCADQNLGVCDMVTITVNELPDAPVAGTMTKGFCPNPDLSPSLANTGVNVTNSLTTDEKVVWVLTGAPVGSAYTVGDLFTTDNCGDGFKNFGELAIANTSKVIRVQDTENVPVGTYTFDAYIENCVTDCTSDLVSGFSITVYATPAVMIAADPDGDLCLGQMDVEYSATITSEDGGTYSYMWCAYNSGDGSGTCFNGFDNNTAAMPTRDWTSSAGAKSVGVTVTSDVQGCEAKDLYSFNVVAPTVVECPMDMSGTLVTDDVTFECAATFSWNHPAVMPGPCDPVTLTITISGGSISEGPTAVTPGDPYSYSFEELGVFTVTYDLEDAAGNTSSCNFNITVDGLPCGFVDNGGVGCSGNTSGFDQGSSAFSLSATNCAPAFPYASDQVAFVFTELCGDGEIIAQVTDVDGTGFAGVMMRDSEAPDAPMVAIGTNRINRVRKEVRIQPGYPAFPQAVLAYNQFWVRLSRTGSQFQAFASTNGINWVPYVNQQVFMSNNCILVGMYVYSEKPGTPINASLDNVFVTGVSTPLTGLNNKVLTKEEIVQVPSISVFPNPTGETLHIDLSVFLGLEVQLQLVSSMGQLVSEKSYSEANALEALDVSNITPGIYSLVVTLGDVRMVERVVITR